MHVIVDHEIAIKHDNKVDSMWNCFITLITHYNGEAHQQTTLNF